MDIQFTIKELQQRGIIPIDMSSYKALTGGTISKVYALLRKDVPVYVLKFNDQEVVQAESQFLSFYNQIGYLPRLVYTDEDHRFLLYSYKLGDVAYPRRNKKEMLCTLVYELIRHYQPFPDADYGYLNEPLDRWRDFLLQRVRDSKDTIGDRMSEEDHRRLYDLVLSKDQNCEKYLLHGDCGVHNFLFSQDTLCAVIDPTPVVGDRIYDLVYAFCSSPDDLSKENILESARLIPHSLTPQEILQETIVGLYFRISTCIWHHPEDLDDYLEAWNSWKEIVFCADSSSVKEIYL